jgi:hypothetical protein
MPSTGCPRDYQFLRGARCASLTCILSQPKVAKQPLKVGRGIYGGVAPPSTALPRERCTGSCAVPSCIARQGIPSSPHGGSLDSSQDPDSRVIILEVAAQSLVPPCEASVEATKALGCEATSTVQGFAGTYPTARVGPPSPTALLRNASGGLEPPKVANVSWQLKTDLGQRAGYCSRALCRREHVPLSSSSSPNRP